MIEANGISEKEYLEYKGRPLVRQGNDIYYGDMSDKYYVYMMILNEKDSVKAGETVPDKVMVQLFGAGQRMPEKQMIENGLNSAFETACAWLDRYNK